MPAYTSSSSNSLCMGHEHIRHTKSWSIYHISKGSHYTSTCILFQVTTLDWTSENNSYIIHKAPTCVLLPAAAILYLTTCLRNSVMDVWLHAPVLLLFYNTLIHTPTITAQTSCSENRGQELTVKCLMLPIKEPCDFTLLFNNTLLFLLIFPTMHYNGKQL